MAAGAGGRFSPGAPFVRVRSGAAERDAENDEDYDEDSLRYH